MPSRFLKDMAARLDALAAAYEGGGDGFAARLRLDVTGEGSVLVELDRKGGRARVAGGPADAAIEIAPDVLAALLDGRIEAQSVFRRGLMRITGDVAKAFAVTRRLRAAALQGSGMQGSAGEQAGEPLA